MHEYLFDAKLFASITIRAPNAGEAERLVKELISGGVLTLDNGGTVDIDTQEPLELMQIDGEDVQ